MVTTNDASEKDLKGYVKKTLWSSGLLLATLIIATLWAATSGSSSYELLMGTLVGASLSTANVFAIGYAFYIIAIKDGKKLALLLPIGTFVAMCITAFVLSTSWAPMLLGFAFGLTAPLLFGAVIIFLT